MNQDILNAKNIGIVAVVLALSGAGIFFYQQSHQAKLDSAKSKLYAVQTTYEAEMAKLSEAEKLKGAAFSVDEKLPQTVQAFRALLGSDSPKQVRYEGAMRLGQLYLEHGQNDAAAQEFKVAVEVAQSELQKTSAYYQLGACLEKSGKSAEALDAYTQALSKKVDGFQSELLLAVVRTHVELKDVQKAKLYLEKLSQEAPGSKQYQTAESLVNSSTMTPATTATGETN